MPRNKEDAVHVPDKIPVYLNTSSGYVLADPVEVYTDGQHTLTAEKVRKPRRGLNRFRKGESVARRLYHRGLHAPSAQPLCCQQDDVVPAVAAPHLRRLQKKKELQDAELLASREAAQYEAAAQRGEVLPRKPGRVTTGVAQQTIDQFMQQPRKYDLITLREDQYDNFTTHFDRFKRNDFTVPGFQASDKSLPDISMGSSFVKPTNKQGKRILHHKNAASPCSPLVLPEKMEMFKSDLVFTPPRAESKEYQIAHISAKTIGLRK
eukprot:NODE_3369_length_905_cov_62.420308_g3347_i0.p1 GENE.NODE_3369_length_905_cov_62.420308_g3347_i0~~NODE_3369_length_905_cov_62.420308_g3347_i0.p1  ORF type:complete len:264 (+),score=46.10 NODE_3369_length_905_cov_62.420308_g3347_i0:87-878(+)